MNGIENEKETEIEDMRRSEIEIEEGSEEGQEAGRTMKTKMTGKEMNRRTNIIDRKASSCFRKRR